ncbi:protocadherin gamma-A6-like [Amia ocellicauda]|uniref:protocadherin gamma-A6-like n=1 Tax=Amia ocellicauda TaxID=2972642 RepID=UPI0034645F82
MCISGIGSLEIVSPKAGFSLKRQVQVFIFWCFFGVICGQIRYSIPEELRKGSFVGNIANDLGIDLKRLKLGGARIVTGDNSDYIELNLDKGILVVKERIDREQLCGQISHCSLSFEVIVSNPMQLHSVVIEIVDINDNSPIFTEKEIKVDIIESALSGTRILQESASDPDVGINALQRYTLNPTDHFNIKIQVSPDGSKYVEIFLKVPLDREKEDHLVLTLTAFDGGEPQRSSALKINILVLDANDNVPAFTQAIYKAEVIENSMQGTTITKVSATDADEGSYGHVSYSFTRVAEDVAELFALNEHTGDITVIGTIDYEKNKHYELNVQAKDHGGHMDSTKVIIEVIDVNDNVPVIAITSFSSTISEDSVSGTTVAIVNVKDLDSGKNGKINCYINKNIPFTIKSNFKNYYTLLTDAALDRERDDEYNITFTAVDEGSPPLSSSKTITLKVSDVNDNVPIFDQSTYSANVMENNSPGVSICSVQARDSDWNQNARISYLLVDSNADGTPVSSYISINSESGAIYAVRSFDYETIKQLQIQIKAQDGGSPPLSSNVTVKIFVQDQNDNSPQILYPVQSGVSLVAEMVARSADVGYLVTKVVAVDADSGQNAWLSYKLLKATDRALFEVGSQNGEIRTSRQVSDKDAVKQRLVVVVEDNGQPSRSATVNVNVAVADSFPEVLSEFSDFTHDKDYNDSLTFYLVLSLAVVSFLFIVSVIVLVSVKVYRWRQSRLFYKSNGNLPVIPSAYYPPRYADVGATGTLQHVYNYEVCMTTDSGKSDIKYVRPCSQNLLIVDPSSTETMQRSQKENNLLEDSGPSTEVSFLMFSGFLLFTM